MNVVSTLLLTAALSASPALASEFEDLAALDRRLAQIGSADPIDRRLRLKRCPEPALLEPGAGMIAVRCVPLGWRLRVPMKAATNGLDAAKPVIRRGEGVNVMIVGETYNVSYDGVAMDDGGVGANIRVKFPTQAAFLTATVTAPGRVQIID